MCSWFHITVKNVIDKTRYNMGSKWAEILQPCRKETKGTERWPTLFPSGTSSMVATLSFCKKNACALLDKILDFRSNSNLLQNFGFSDSLVHWLVFCSCISLRFKNRPFTFLEIKDIQYVNSRWLTFAMNYWVLVG